jgi:branched-chain amino acid transport system permease protein
MTAALVGGFTSFGLTTMTAFLLGMQMPVIQALGVREEWYPKAGSFAIPGVENMIPLLVIVLTLFLRGDSLPQRGTSTLGQLPRAPSPSSLSLRVTGPIAAAVTLVAALFWLTPDFRGALTNSLIGIIVCLSVVVVTGYVGQLSLAPLAFGGIAAFTVAELSHDRGWPFPLPIVVGMLAAVLVGLLVAVPAFRIRGVSLAIVTIAFALACDKFVFDNENVNGGLDRALVDVPPLIDQSRSVTYRIAGLITAGDGRQPNPMTTVFCLVVVVILCYVVANLRRSNTGRHMLAVRTNERAAAAAGVNVAGTKALAFAISAAIAGLGGCVIAYRSGSADQSRFTYSQSLLLFAFAYLGGITRVSGAVVGGLLVSGGVAFTFAERSLGVPPEFGLLLGGAGLVISAVANPEGIASKGGRFIGRLVHRGGAA